MAVITSVAPYTVLINSKMHQNRQRLGLRPRPQYRGAPELAGFIMLQTPKKIQHYGWTGIF